MIYEFVNIAESNRYKLEAAKILFAAFSKKEDSSWPDIQKAMIEVEECIEAKNISKGIIYKNELVGWVGLRPMYEKTWELHPMVIKPEFQGKGIGRILLNEIEINARSNGIIGLVLGTDDEDYSTSLSMVELKKKNVFNEVSNIKNLHQHPYEFYQKCGYMIIGVIPNANGKNKPDIWMWKNLL